MNKELFPLRSKSSPTIYAYKLLGVEGKEGFLKVGFTNRDAKTRVSEQLKTAALKYEIVLEKSAMRSNGTSFSDHDVHQQLVKDKIQNIELEWFKCEIEDVESAIIAVRDGLNADRNRNLDFKMRPEQYDAVKKLQSILKVLGF